MLKFLSLFVLVILVCGVFVEDFVNFKELSFFLIVNEVEYNV